MEDYERILLVKNDVQVFKVPPKTTGRAYRASEWNLDNPDWACRLRLISLGKKCFIKLDEKNTGQFFGQCPIESYSSDSVEAVSDSSRYFVIKLVNEESGRSAHVGIGFIDRSDSFDLNVALQDHFKMLKHEEEDAGSSKEAAPKLDLGFKDGQTIKVNLNLKKKPAATKPKSTIGLGLGGVLLPPPPGGKALSSSTSTASTASVPAASSSTSAPAPTSGDITGDLDKLTLNSDSNSHSFADFADDWATTPKPSEQAPKKDSKSNVNLLLDFGAFENNSAEVVSPNNSTENTVSSNSSQSLDNWTNFQ